MVVRHVNGRKVGRNCPAIKLQTTRFPAVYIARTQSSASKQIFSFVRVTSGTGRRPTAAQHHSASIWALARTTHLAPETRRVKSMDPSSVGPFDDSPSVDKDIAERRNRR